MKNNNKKDKKYIELIWAEKYKDFVRPEKKTEIERIALPFQITETVNEPRIKEYEASLGKMFQPKADYPENYPQDWKNKLIWGDNKIVMESLLRGDKSSGIPSLAGKINLIYIDPPFFTGADFSIKTKIGDTDVTKEQSFIEERAYRDMWSGGIASYLRYMYERLVLMRELLVENGSIYVHLDWHVGHYVKVMMDEIFGYNNFRNELTWCYRTGGAPSKEAEFPKKHEMILFYSKGTDLKFKKLKERIYYEKPFFTPLRDSTGKYYADVLLRDVLQDEVIIVLDNNKLLKVSVKPVLNVSGECLNFQTQKPEGLLQILLMTTTEPGDIVADFFSGSGTTLAVAEKLGRRWIGSDLSKFAIHLTRKRLMDIHNSKDLLDEKKRNYGKPARPFEIWNVGNYETIYWEEKLEEYLSFILKLYQAQPITGFKYMHGKKGDRIVHVSSLNAPVTMDEVKKVILECRANGFNKADILGWEWAYEVNELAKELAKKNGVDLRLIQIPSINEIKSALTGFDLKLLKIPEQVTEKEVLPHIRFHEVAYLEVKPKIRGREVSVRLIDFQLPPSRELDEIKDKIKNFSDLIDYWAVDWDYKKDTFHNQWQSFRTKKEPRVESEASYKYVTPGKKKIMVKVVDVFGNDTNKVLEVEIK